MGKIGEKTMLRINKERLPDNATKEDLRNMGEKLERRIEALKEEVQPHKAGLPQLTGKMMKMMGRGVSDIGKSLSQPSTEGRPRISQLPSDRSHIPVAAHHLDLSRLKDSRYGDNVSGRKRSKSKE